MSLSILRRVVFGAVLLVSCGRHDRPPPGGNASASSAPVEHLVPGQRVGVSARGFSLRLPEGWVARPPRAPNDPDVYMSPDEAAQVTVSSFEFTTVMDNAQRQQTLDALLKHRLDAERRGMGPAMTATEPRRSVKGNVVSVRYEGTDPTAGHRFATMVMVAPTGAWAFFLEGSDHDSPEAFQHQSERIFDSIEIHD
jgi:hypothetical protein